MSRWLSWLVVPVLLFSSTVFAQTKAKAQNVPEIPYESVPNFLKFPPGLYLGEAMGVATNSKGHIFVYTRSANTRLFEFDQNGKYVREIGEGNYGFEFAHSVRVDPEDNIWAVDEGTNMVLKFNPAGRIVMVLGHRPDAIAGAVAQSPAPNVPAEKYILGRPTDVAWDAQGNIFVSDGYINHRVVKYDKNGRFLEAGRQREARLGTQPVQHAARDRGRRARQRVRGRSRQPPDAGVRQQPGPKAIYDNIGDSWTVCISPGPHQYLFTSNSNPNGNAPGSWDITGEIYKMELDGTIVGRFGHASKEFGGFQVVHMMDCRNPNEIIVAEIESWRVQKLILKPQARESFGVQIGDVMKHHLQVLFAAALISGLPAGAQSPAPEISFDSAADPLKFPANVHLGEAAGVATNSKGDVFVYTRTGHPTISIGTARPFAHGGSRLFQFDKNGKFVREIGQDSYAFLVAQQVRVDPQDNIWVVDQMASMVIKFDPNGQVQLLLGRKSESERVPAPAGPAAGQAAGGRGGRGGSRARASRATCFSGPPTWRGTRPATSM